MCGNALTFDDIQVNSKGAASVDAAQGGDTTVSDPETPMAPAQTSWGSRVKGFLGGVSSGFSAASTFVRAQVSPSRTRPAAQPTEDDIIASPDQQGIQAVADVYEVKASLSPLSPTLPLIPHLDRPATPACRGPRASADPSSSTFVGLTNPHSMLSSTTRTAWHWHNN